MAAEQLDLNMEQGSRFTLAFTYVDDELDENGDPVLDDNGDPVPGEPRDFTGWSARMQVRKTFGSPVLIDLTNEQITLGSDGSVVIDIGADLTDNLIEVSGSRIGQAIKTGVYDLEIVEDADPTNVERLLEGKVNVDPNVTREDA